MSTHKMRVKVSEIRDTKEFGTNGFKKRELIGLIEGEHPQKFLFEFVNDKVDLLDAVMEDSYITIFYNVRCREVEKEGADNMFFTSLSGWKLEA